MTVAAMAKSSSETYMKLEHLSQGWSTSFVLGVALCFGFEDILHHCRFFWQQFRSKNGQPLRLWELLLRCCCWSRLCCCWLGWGWAVFCRLAGNSRVWTNNSISTTTPLASGADHSVIWTDAKKNPVVVHNVFKPKAQSPTENKTCTLGLTQMP